MLARRIRRSRRARCGRAHLQHAHPLPHACRRCLQPLRGDGLHQGGDGPCPRRTHGCGVLPLEGIRVLRILRIFRHRLFGRAARRIRRAPRGGGTTVRVVRRRGAAGRLGRLQRIAGASEGRARAYALVPLARLPRRRLLRERPARPPAPPGRERRRNRRPARGGDTRRGQRRASLLVLYSAALEHRPERIRRGTRRGAPTAVRYGPHPREEVASALPRPAARTYRARVH